MHHAIRTIKAIQRAVKTEYEHPSVIRVSRIVDKLSKYEFRTGFWGCGKESDSPAKEAKDCKNGADGAVERECAGLQVHQEWDNQQSKIYQKGLVRLRESAHGITSRGESQYLPVNIWVKYGHHGTNDVGGIQGTRRASGSLG